MIWHVVNIYPCNEERVLRARASWENAYSRHKDFKPCYYHSAEPPKVGEMLAWCLEGVGDRDLVVVTNLDTVLLDDAISTVKEYGLVYSRRIDHPTVYGRNLVPLEPKISAGFDFFSFPREWYFHFPDMYYGFELWDSVMRYMIQWDDGYEPAIPVVMHQPHPPHWVRDRKSGKNWHNILEFRRWATESGHDLRKAEPQAWE